jgi:hypothetical protein
MVELEIQEIPETVEPEIAMRFAQTFECAAYGTYGSTLAFRANLKRRTQDTPFLCIYTEIK